MNWLVIFVALLFVPFGCSESDSPPAPGPFFPQLDGSSPSDSGTEPRSPAADTQAETDTNENVVEAEDVESTSDSEEVEAQDSDVSADTDASSELEDAQTPGSEVTEAQPDSQTPSDTAEDTVETGTETPDATEIDNDTSESEDAAPGEDAAEEEEEGECQTDDDCLLLTAKECCPSLGVCPGLRDAGTLAEEVEALSWIQTECPAVESCPPLEEPSCLTCSILATVSPVCDLELGECVAQVTPVCEELCAAEGSDPECPILFTGGADLEELSSQCDCTP